MEKIEFKNNSEPYLSAENLNQIQTNVENSIIEIEKNNNENKVNLGGRILWSNPDGNIQMGTPTAMNLSSPEYDCYEIIYVLSTTNQDYYFSSGKIPKGKGTVLNLATGSSSGIEASQRNIVYVNETQLRSDSCYKITANSRIIDATILIPIFIIGYNTKLFK